MLINPLTLVHENDVEEHAHNNFASENINTRSKCVYERKNCDVYIKIFVLSSMKFTPPVLSVQRA